MSEFWVLSLVYGCTNSAFVYEFPPLPSTQNVLPTNSVFIVYWDGIDRHFYINWPLMEQNNEKRHFIIWCEPNYYEA